MMHRTRRISKQRRIFKQQSGSSLRLKGGTHDISLLNRNVFTKCCRAAVLATVTSLTPAGFGRDFAPSVKVGGGEQASVKRPLWKYSFRDEIPSLYDTSSVFNDNKSDLQLKTTKGKDINPKRKLNSTSATTPKLELDRKSNLTSATTQTLKRSNAPSALTPNLKLDTKSNSTSATTQTLERSNAPSAPTPNLKLDRKSNLPSATTQTLERSNASSAPTSNLPSATTQTLERSNASSVPTSNLPSATTQTLERSNASSAPTSNLPSATTQTLERSNAPSALTSNLPSATRRKSESCISETPTKWIALLADRRKSAPLISNTDSKPDSPLDIPKKGRGNYFKRKLDSPSASTSNLPSATRRKSESYISETPTKWIALLADRRKSAPLISNTDSKPDSPLNITQERGSKPDKGSIRDVKSDTEIISKKQTNSNNNCVVVDNKLEAEKDTGVRSQSAASQKDGVLHNRSHTRSVTSFWQRLKASAKRFFSKCSSAIKKLGRSGLKQHQEVRSKF